MSRHAYNSEFMQYAAQSSAYAAETITTLIAREVQIESVLDVGCAQGTWLRAWSRRGVADYCGIDGDYVDRSRLEIPSANFTPIDLNKGFELGRQFDLVQSLEVAEHLAPESSGAIAESLARHAKSYVLFSAAPPGQGGEFHINERPYEYWRGLFATQGFVAVDAIRPAVIQDQAISYWYRYNMFLFVRRTCLNRLSAPLLARVEPDERELSDLSPVSFRMRKAIVMRLPRRVQHQVARLKSKFLPTGRL